MAILRSNEMTDSEMNDAGQLLMTAVHQVWQQLGIDTYHQCHVMAAMLANQLVQWARSADGGLAPDNFQIVRDALDALLRDYAGQAFTYYKVHLENAQTDQPVLH